MVERMNLSLFLFLAGIRNWIEHMDAPWNLDCLVPLLLVFGSELLVDWLKHAFITKFNLLPCTVYLKFRMAIFPTFSSSPSSSPSSSFTYVASATARKLGFSPLPLTLLFVRMALDLSFHWSVGVVLLISLFLIKLRLGYFLVVLGFKYAKQGDPLPSLGKLDRYTLVKSRIP